MSTDLRERPEQQLERQISRTRQAMRLEALAQAFWPTTTALMAFGAAWAFGLLGWLGPEGALVGLVLAGLVVLACLMWGARTLRWPSRDDAVLRLDTELPGRPISALGDRIAVGANNPGSEALWRAHLRRMAERAAAAKASKPDLRVSRLDPFALRLGAAVALVAAAIFARAPGPLDVAVPLTGGADASVAQGPSFEAWANPPAYTGRPTLYLTADSADTLDLPVGTEVTVRVYGAEEEGHRLSETVSDGTAALETIAEGIASASFQVTRDGRFGLIQNGDELAGWDVTMIPDAAPTIELDGELDRAAGGAMELSFIARDDYGVARAEAVITLDLEAMDRRYGLSPEPVTREAIALDLPMPLSGGTEEVEETLVEDLSKHPWAGLPVKITLRAEDAAGQPGSVDTTAQALPMRRFFDPLARALLEQRRDLLWSPENVSRVDQMLRVITHAPEDVFTNKTAFMVTRMALRRMGYAGEDGLSTEELEDVAEMLWQAALLVEDGSLGDARERLQRARERLSDALRNGATEEEIAELMQELREAMQDYMQQLAEEALRNPDQMAQQPPPGDMMELSQDQLQQLMDRIQELAESGQQEQAQALLDQLMQMLENLQMQAQQGGGGQQQQGQQMMQELQDTLRQQQDLADDSFQELQRQFNQDRQGQQQQQGQQGQQGQQQPGQQGGQGQQGQQFGQGQQGQGQQQPGQQGQGGQMPSAEELARRQEALRQMLDGLRGQLPGPSTQEGADARERLGEAERSMDGARQSLEEGALDDALDQQAEALDALREGIRGLGEELQQQAQQGQGDAGQEPGEGFARDNRDPLGRPSGSQGNIRTDEHMLPGEDMMRRAQELFDEIRRRSGEQSRPEVELDYLRRLLDRF